MSTNGSTTTGAVTFHRDTARAWLDTTEEFTADCLEGFSRHTEDFTGTVRSLLYEATEDLADPSLPTGVFSLADRAMGIEVWRIADGDGATVESIITLDLPNGVRLASLCQDARDYTRESGVEAALDCLAHIARICNALYATYAAAIAGDTS